MALHLFNTLTRLIEPFQPLDPAGRAVGMYCCGPTIHDFAHIGNFRTFVTSDFVRRYLEFRGYAVTHVMNITDVEDKIIRRVRETGTSLKDYTQRYEAAFLEDHRTLNCLPPHHTPRATEYIAEIVDLIRRLEARGLAYRAPDGSVYFAIDKYRGCGCRYGQLVNLNPDQLRPGERVSADEYEKESVADFALWKARVPEDGEVFWPSPWGEGRPGWHIECSAMSMKLLGPSFDLHLGGEDLVFPHHEDEIAQSEAASGKPFARCWCHGEFLLTDGAKMAKRVGNVQNVADLRANGVSGAAVRHFVFSTHYRKQLNLAGEALEGSMEAVRRVGDFADRLASAKGGTRALEDAADRLENEVRAALFDDLNAPNAMAALFEFIRAANKELDAGGTEPGPLSRAREVFRMVDAILDLVPERDRVDGGLAVWVEAQLSARAEARARRDFGTADEIRRALDEKGIVIEDTPGGTRWKQVR